MLNIEYYKNEINEYVANSKSPKDVYKIRDAFYYFASKHMDEIKDANNLIDFLLSEYVEVFKLTKTDFIILDDLLEKRRKFREVHLLNRLKEAGQFKYIDNTDVSIVTILNNCVIVED